MPWPFEDIFAGPGPADPPPEEDAEEWALLDRVAAAAVALAQRLRHEPGLPRAAGELFCKTNTNVPGIHFRSLIWPLARRLAGLPAQKRGRPRRAKNSAEI